MEEVNRSNTDRVYGKNMPRLLEELEINFEDRDELSITKETLKKVFDRAGEIIDITAIKYNDGMD